MIKIRNRIQIKTKYGICTFVSFSGLGDHLEHFALVFKNAHHHRSPIVRVHSECITGDLFGSCKCDCGKQLNEALSLFQKSGGILLYLRQEGRGIGLYNKLDAYALQEKGFDTFEANVQLNLPKDSRSFSVAAKMLKALRVKHIHLLSNNPDKYNQLKLYGIHIRKVIHTRYYVNVHNKKYLKAKIKVGHIFLSKLHAEARK